MGSAPFRKRSRNVTEGVPYEWLFPATDPCSVREFTWLVVIGGIEVGTLVLGNRGIWGATEMRCIYLVIEEPRPLNLANFTEKS